MPRLLDLFCGAGGASMGYHRAGFEVVGVDIKKQPRYPFPFIQADWEGVVGILNEFDAVHASPPCQKDSVLRRGRWKDREHPDLIAPVRAHLKGSGLPYVIENVVGAKLENPMLLCGTMFGLRTAEGSQLRRHRLFECPWWFDLIPQCQHNNGKPIGPDRRPASIGVWGNAGGKSKRDGLQHYGTDARRVAMGCDWMEGKELSEAIPPAYTKYIGEQLLAFLLRAKVA